MIPYSLTMRSNPADREQPQKAYANAQSRQILDINQFAAHITGHGCVYSRGDIAAILTMAVDCIKEQILAGNAVQLGDLGKFSARLTCKGAPSFEEFNSQAHIRKVNVRWAPGTLFKNLKDEAVFERVLTKDDLASAKKKAYN